MGLKILMVLSSIYSTLSVEMKYLFNDTNSIDRDIHDYKLG
jgi:hypothetical protein